MVRVFKLIVTNASLGILQGFLIVNVGRYTFVSIAITTKQRQVMCYDNTRLQLGYCNIITS